MNNIMKTLAVRLAAIAIVTGLAASANAVYYTFDGTVIGKSATVKIDGTQKGVQAVLYKLETAESGYISPLWSICTDINGKLKSGNYQVVDFAGNQGTSPAWSEFGIYNAAYIFMKNRDAAKADATIAAGLQLASWEALYDSSSLNDGGLDLSGGRFSVVTATDAVKAAAEAILDELGGTGFVKLNGKWLKPVLKDGTLDRTRQGGIYVPDGGLTVILLGLGLGAMALVGRRVKNA